MVKNITSSQLLGEQGEAAVRARFLNMGFQFDQRGRLEAGIDGIVEVMDNNGVPLGSMIAVQVKTTASTRYPGEDEKGFTYLLKSDDLQYWRGSNLPVVIVLHRTSDNTYYWQDVSGGIGAEEKRLVFDKARDVLDTGARDRLADLTVSKAGFGYYVPPLGEGEEAIVNMLPLTLPEEIFVVSTPHSAGKAASILLNGDEPPRFDWVIKGETFWSFADPRTSVCKDIIDLDQVEVIDTNEIAFHDDMDEQNNFAFLLKKALDHQVRSDLAWSKDRKLFYFKAPAANTGRTFAYDASKKRASTEVVNVAYNKTDKTRVEFVRHHAFVPRFERLSDHWYLILNPTYFFTTNGLLAHSYPAALLAGKKRLDNSASLRGQVIMWHRFLSQGSKESTGSLFEEQSSDPCLIFGNPPTLQLPTRVPEDVWGSPKKLPEVAEVQERLFG